MERHWVSISTCCCQAHHGCALACLLALRLQGDLDNPNLDNMYGVRSGVYRADPFSHVKALIFWALTGFIHCIIIMLHVSER
jgi:hypothetical protein